MFFTRESWNFGRLIAIYNLNFLTSFPHNIPRKEGAGMVRDMYISPLVEASYTCAKVCQYSHYQHLYDDNSRVLSFAAPHHYIIHCKDIFWKGTSAKINRGKGNRSFVSDSTWLYNRQLSIIWMSSLRCTYSGGGDYHYFKGGETLNVHSFTSMISWQITVTFVKAA